MSLLGTLAKVAVGIAVAKGVGGMMRKSGGGAASSGGGLLGDLLSGGASQKSGQAQGGGLGDLLGSVLGGGQGGSGGGNKGMSGGLGGLLEQLAGGQGGAKGGGGLGDLLGSLTGGAGGGGGIGDVLGGLLGGAAKSGGNTGSFGEMLNDSFQRGGEPEVQPSQEHEALAALMLRAMIQATKADGELDKGEHEKLIFSLGDISKEEMAFVNHEMQQPVDIEGLAQQVPRGLEQQVYTMSVMAIDLDSQAEAQYLDKLRTAMGMNQNQANMIHDELGVQKPYG